MKKHEDYIDNIKLREVDRKYLQRLKSWLEKDYIKKWLGDFAEWIKEIEDFTWINHYIVILNNKPIEFCQYYDCYNGSEIEDWYKVKNLNEVFSIDYFIGESDYLNKGYGKKIVDALLKVIINNESPKKIIVQPEKDNIISCKVLIANGFNYDEKLQYYIKKIL